MIVRPATFTDADAMAWVHTASSNAAYGTSGGLERRTDAWRNLLAEGLTRSYLAESAGQVVGVLHVTDDELRVLYVLPDHWGTAAGQMLIDRAHELLAETCEEATLTVLAANPRARRFYERNGWQLTETLVEPHFGGEPTEVCRYQKTFAT